ncbi:histone family protein DNA-binding protein [Sediminispirochaeta smaragdinae DSM 11293]|uniref:Histone family protein DNA-binding protein n=2 Tax=Sediminispirochaeta TaxID=1911556 RepID=E1R8A8_SEDSS|nr:histone family protein DNA-binding protein [Sediminispirochaeta smaragdinae DSM 11293]
MNNDKQVVETMPKVIEQHLKGLAATLDFVDAEEGFSRLKQAWSEKERLFTGQTRLLEMAEIKELAEDDSRGCILLTNSGSLLSLFPHTGEGRAMEYASIPIRSDVPDIIREQDVTYAPSLSVGNPAILHGAPIKKTSPVYRIAVCEEGVSPAEQAKRIREATIFLTNGFARINRTIETPMAGKIEHFTKDRMAAYIAGRNDLTQLQVRRILDDFFSVVESGIMLGERVSLGSLGKIGYRVRPPSKARIITVPATGEEMTIPAKPSRAVVKFSPSGRLKERAEAIPIEEETDD